MSYSKYKFITVNSLYIDTRYNYKTRYNDNLTGTKPLTVNQKLCKNTVFHASSYMCFGYLLELPHWGNSNKYSKHVPQDIDFEGIAQTPGLANTVKPVLSKNSWEA